VKQPAKAKPRAPSKSSGVEKANRRKDARPDRRRLSRGGRRSSDPTREEREHRIDTIVEYISKRKAGEKS